MEEYIKQLFTQILEPIQNKLDFIIENIANIGQGKPVMNTKEVAEYLGISKGWIDKNYNNIPHFRLGNRPMFNKEDIDQWRLSKSSTLKDRFGKATIRPVKK